MQWSLPPFRAMGYCNGAQAYGSVNVGMGGIVFDPAATPVANRLIRLIYPSGKAPKRVVHTVSPVSFLRSKRGRFLELVDSEGGNRVLVRIQANRVAKVRAALEAGGFQYADEELSDDELRRRFGA